MKITIILDHLGIPYTLQTKRIMVARSGLRTVFAVLANRNNESALRHYIATHFPSLLHGFAPDSVVFDFALEYSRNIAFDRCINYGSVLLFLADHKCDFRRFHDRH